MHTVLRALSLLAGIFIVADLAVATGQRQVDPLQPYEDRLGRSLRGAPAARSEPRQFGAASRSSSATRISLHSAASACIACTVDSGIQTSTAFLVGAFDIGVTVAHTFENGRHDVTPTDCVYTSIDSLGQIRERIPVAYVRSQWEAEAGAFGQPSKDIAVFRLSQPSRYAQKTMPLGRFTGDAAPVVMVGYKRGHRLGDDQAQSARHGLRARRRKQVRVERCPLHSRHGLARHRAGRAGDRRAHRRDHRHPHAPARAAADKGSATA